jgi:opacity protein-like surface antigen
MKKLLIALCLMTASVMAQDTEVMNQQQLEYQANSKTNIIGYFRTRYDVTQDHMLQIKPGLIVERKIGANVTALVGYYNQTDWSAGKQQYVNAHRAWTGARWIFFRKGDHILESRYLFETFRYPDRIQVRSRARLWWELRNHYFVPSASYEYLRFQNTNTNRINAMISHHFNRHLTVGAGFELRQIPSTMQYDRIPFTLVRYHIK